MIPGFAAIALLLMVNIVTRKRLPARLALSFDNVYILRRGGWFQTGKVFSYVMDYSRMIFIPLRSGYSTAIGFFVYSVYNLSGAGLLTSLGFGSWMLIVFVLIFYQTPRTGSMKRSGEIGI